MKVQLGAIDQYRKTYPLLLDGEEWHTVHLSIFGRSPSFPDVSQEELEERFALLEKKGAKLFLLRRISAKSYHSAELFAAFKKRGVSTQTSEPLIAEFQNLGYLNDVAWLSSMVRILRSQRIGYAVILQKLRRKGILESDAKDAIQLYKEEEGEDQNERASIEKLLSTRFRKFDLSDPKQRKKAIAALVRKGYSLDDIFTVIRNLALLAK